MALYEPRKWRQPDGSYVDPDNTAVSTSIANEGLPIPIP